MIRAFWTNRFCSLAWVPVLVLVLALHLPFSAQARMVRQANLTDPNTEEGEAGGADIVIDGDTIVVGASFEASEATGVDGDQTRNQSPGAGVAYVFKRSSTQCYMLLPFSQPSAFYRLRVPCPPA